MHGRHGALRAIDAEACLRFSIRSSDIRSPRPGGEEQWTARVAFGYSPLFGCFLLTSPPVLLEKGTVAWSFVFHQWNVSPILVCSSREGTVHLRRGLRPLDPSRGLLVTAGSTVWPTAANPPPVRARVFPPRPARSKQARSLY